MKKSLFRTELLLGSERMNTLSQCSVIVFGIGGVGGYAVEALCRCGLKSMTLVDFDTVDETNINRQIIATHGSVGSYKTELMAKRIQLIAPEMEIIIKTLMLTEDTVADFKLESYDYVIDAIDMFQAKMALIEWCSTHKIPIISAMGAGNKIRPEQFEITDIHKTYNCPLAKKVRLACRQKRISKLCVVFSPELPVQERVNRDIGIPSIAFVPATAGLIMASKVIRDLSNSKEEKKCVQ